VPQDDAQAVAWYRHAAEQGHANAQFNLGVMYANGRGVPKDDTQAVAWFRHAADVGDADAQFNLGVMYANGRGVPQDDTLAYLWLNYAAARVSGSIREEAANLRDDIARRLPPR
jgi:TPR repeat protein